MICINLMTSGMHKTLESRRFRDSNREQASRLAREYYARNREKCIATVKKYQAANHDKVAQRWRDNANKRRENLSGWTTKMVEATRIEQGNRCAVCRREFKDTKDMHADHKHVTPPEPRGLLCGPCNHALGLFKDDPEICLAAKDYLEVWS